ncbi:hypothetical protein KVR01_007978 [Diaporthe batatas]|uniref:uncharacterized protein n=1 Tax=Diaporthe batatas TaxID=748121 RepID=UPI001D03DB49|nr:uncharacterized protein KVR01_007978 [Diaporthe batatas]KAG8162213.1 hypothetical protein KVR01_007978 [Diaporthe batatas]
MEDTKFNDLDDSIVSDEIRNAVASALADETNPVDVYFRALPPPEEHERFHLGDDATLEYANNRYNVALSVFWTFAPFYGVDRINSQCESDPILARLVEIIEKAIEPLDLDSFPVIDDKYMDNHMPGSEMYRGLQYLVWDTGVTGGTADLAPYCEETQNLLRYLSWIVLGRKDSTCMVAKPWKSHRRPLPVVGFDGDYRYLPSTRNASGLDAEDIPLSRLARLFQVTFNQCLVSNTYSKRFYVRSSDGIISVKHNLLEGDRDRGWENMGMMPDVDLGRSEVRAALHNSACCVVTSWGSPLVELFFRQYCASIDVLQFLIRNAATTLECNTMTLQFNMQATHTVLVLTTAMGHKFVLDSSGRQFGWVETLSSSEEYKRFRIDHETDFEPYMPPARPEKRVRDTMIPCREPEWTDWWERSIVEDIEELTKTHLDTNGGIGCILKLPASRFDSHCLNFEASLGAAMRARDDRRKFDRSFHVV